MIDVFPENVSGTEEPGTICGVPAAPSSGIAIATCVMGRSFTPNAFEMRRRMYDSAAIDVWMVWRIVEFVKIELVPFYENASGVSTLSMDEPIRGRTKGGFGTL